MNTFFILCVIFAALFFLYQIRISVLYAITSYTISLMLKGSVSSFAKDIESYDLNNKEDLIIALQDILWRSGRKYVDGLRSNQILLAPIVTIINSVNLLIGFSDTKDNDFNISDFKKKIKDEQRN